MQAVSMHNVEEEGKRAQQNRKQGGKKRKQSSRDARPSKKGGKLNHKVVSKSPGKSGSKGGTRALGKGKNTKRVKRWCDFVNCLAFPPFFSNEILRGSMPSRQKHLPVWCWHLKIWWKASSKGVDSKSSCSFQSRFFPWLDLKMNVEIPVWFLLMKVSQHC